MSKDFKLDSLGGFEDTVDVVTTPIKYEEAEPTNKRGFFKGFIDGFRKIEVVDEALDPNLTDVERANILADRSPLKRNLKNRHIQMIAIGGSIGTGLFVGSGSSLATGGPAPLIICYFLIGTMVFSSVQALGELSVAFPISGSFLSLTTRMVSPIWSFAMAWNYGLQWIVLLPLELVAAALTIGYWNNSVNGAAWVSIFYALIVFINIFGVKGYGEAEFLFSAIKVIAVVGFVILGIVLNCGGGPVGGYIGGKYWHDPGAFNHGFKGFCGVFVSAAFAFAGTELIGLVAAETENPRKTLPKAAKQVFWRITLFYLVALTMVGLLVPYNDPRLIGNSDVSASPFVIAIRNAGIGGLPSVMNVVILVSVLSVGNSSVYGCSRTIATMANQGFLPKCCGYIDRKGRPAVGVLITLVFGLLCFLAATPKQEDVFDWMMALSGLSSIFTWGTICLCHLRFRMALKAQGRSTDELSFTAMGGIWGSIWSVVLNVLVLIVQFWVALFPEGSADAYNFFQLYLNAAFVLFCIGVFLVWKRFKVTWIIPIKEIDIDTGRRVEDWDLLKQEIADEKAFIASKPWYYRLYNMWC